MQEMECQIEVDHLDAGRFAEKLKVLIKAEGKGCQLNTRLLEIDVCSNQAQEYETLLDIGPKELMLEESKFREAIINLLAVLWSAGISTKTYHEFSIPLPNNGNKDCR
jgi:hypothetical protein